MDVIHPQSFGLLNHRDSAINTDDGRHAKVRQRLKTDSTHGGGTREKPFMEWNNISQPRKFIRTIGSDRHVDIWRHNW